VMMTGASLGTSSKDFWWLASLMSPLLVLVLGEGGACAILGHQWAGQGECPLPGEPLQDQAEEREGGRR
jgi:hypothetical protein